MASKNRAVAPLLGPDLKDPLGVADGLADLLAFVDGQRERLLTVHVLAGQHRFDGDLDVPMVGRPDGHDVHVLAIQDLAIVGKDLALAVVLGGKSLGVSAIDVRTGHHHAFAARVMADPAAAATNADRSDSQLVAGRLGGLARWVPEVRDRQSSSDNPRRRLQEIAACSVLGQHDWVLVARRGRRTGLSEVAGKQTKDPVGCGHRVKLNRNPSRGCRTRHAAAASHTQPGSRRGPDTRGQNLVRYDLDYSAAGAGAGVSGAGAGALRSGSRGLGSRGRSRGLGSRRRSRGLGSGRGAGVSGAGSSGAGAGAGVFGSGCGAGVFRERAPEPVLPSPGAGFHAGVFLRRFGSRFFLGRFSSRLFRHLFCRCRRRLFGSRSWGFLGRGLRGRLFGGGRHRRIRATHSRTARWLWRGRTAGENDERSDQNGPTQHRLNLHETLLL